jgi:hypothetical protein
MVKSTIKSDMLVWLKSIDNNLKHQPKQFWNYVSKLRKDSDSPAQYQVDGAHVTTEGEIASAFCKLFESVYGNTPSGVLKFPFSLCGDTLVVASVNDDDVCKAIKRLRSTKVVGLDSIISFVVNGCSEIFVPYLSLSLTLVCPRRQSLRHGKQPLYGFLIRTIRRLSLTTGLLSF